MRIVELSIVALISVVICGISCQAPLRSERPLVDSHKQVASLTPNSTVASFTNPYGDPEAAHAVEVLRRLLEQHGIESALGGFGGSNRMQLLIYGDRVAEARELVRHAIAAQKLQAEIVE